jgi:uncharacterized membrane protein HdeD (DUF308 family)
MARSSLWRDSSPLARASSPSPPGITIGVVVVLFAIGASGRAFFQAVQASSDSALPVLGLLLAVLHVAAAVVAVAWPGIIAYALTIWIGIWAVAAADGRVRSGIRVRGRRRRAGAVRRQRAGVDRARIDGRIG